jgi:ADP-heptose:LPS heptosyltransferase
LTILLIRLRLIGDVVFTTPAIRALREHYPDARLLYLVESAAAPVVTGNSHLSEVIAVPHTRGWARVRDDVRLARRLRRERCDVVIDFHGGPRSAWLARATGAKRRVGYDIQGRAWMYTDVVHRPIDHAPAPAPSASCARKTRKVVRLQITHEKTCGLVTPARIERM